LADESRTERATPRRRQKARERGQVVRSRELPAAIALLAVTMMLWWFHRGWLEQCREILVRLLSSAVHADFASETPPLVWAGRLTIQWAAPALLLGWGVALAGSLAVGGFVFAPSTSAPKSDRLNPATNLRRLFSFAALPGLLKSLVPTSLILYFAVAIFAREWNQIPQLSQATPRGCLRWMLGLSFEMAWKTGLVFLLWSGLDILLAHFRHERELRMTREELREELKETEGHPTVRGRIRRLQREMRRRRMLRDVARATVVVTNPDEFAVALEYRPQTMVAPVVVAKGRRLLARMIKQEARWHGIPLVENPTLAQALYRATEVGRAIPAKLYAAVAEILAFVYRTQMRVASAAGATPGARI